LRSCCGWQPTHRLSNNKTCKITLTCGIRPALHPEPVKDSDVKTLLGLMEVTFKEKDSDGLSKHCEKTQEEEAGAPMTHVVSENILETIKPKKVKTTHKVRNNETLRHGHTPLSSLEHVVTGRARAKRAKRKKVKEISLKNKRSYGLDEWQEEADQNAKQHHPQTNF
jgi:hypothetical protein